MQTIPLWPTLMYDFQWADHARHRDALREVCYDLERSKRTSGVAPDAKGGLYESEFNFVEIDHPAVVEFSHFVKNSFFQAACDANRKYWPQGMSVSVEIHESWCHITRDGGFHDMHIHPMSSWSAIYYLDTGDMNPGNKNGVNRFFSPIDNMYIDAGTSWIQANNSIDFRGEEGMLIVFPSWIHHSAVTYRGSKDRIVIAANCRVNRADLSSVTLAT